MLTIILSIIAMLFLFGITVFVHEFGHFIVARKCGLVVETFSIGMGPALWKKEIGGITYKIGAFPIGGYVSLPQLDPEGMEKMQGENENDRNELPEVSPWKKIAVAVAGPVFNIVFGIFLAWVVYLSSSNLPTLEEQLPMVGAVDESSEAYAQGLRAGDVITQVNGTSVKTWIEFVVEGMLKSGDAMQIDLTVNNSEGSRTMTLKTMDPEENNGDLIDGVAQAIPCLLGAVNQNSPAEKAQLKANDIVTEFNGQTVRDWIHFTDLVQTAPDEPVKIAVKRKGERFETTITPEYSEQYKRVMVGVGLGNFRMKPMDQIKQDGFMVFRVLKGLMTPKESGKVAGSIQGPVGIFKLLWSMIQIGFVAAISFTRMININLAILNLLPIPVLDGGHICFATWEGVTRRKVPAKLVSTLVQIFASILIILMIFLSLRDTGLFRRLKHEKDTDAPKVESVQTDATATNAPTEVPAVPQPE